MQVQVQAAAQVQFRAHVPNYMLGSTGMQASIHITRCTCRGGVGQQHAGRDVGEPLRGGASCGEVVGKVGGAGLQSYRQRLQVHTQGVRAFNATPTFSMEVVLHSSFCSGPGCAWQQGHICMHAAGRSCTS